MTRSRSTGGGARQGTPLRRAAVAALCLIGLLAGSPALAGCAVRLETPAPTTPAPGAAETARQDAVADALAIADLATAAAADPGSAALAERPELAEVLL
uniref:hypothetical protein n=1 Tax=Actinotalea sp. TaxID=1872145 RepID=UPI003564917E